MMQLGGDELEVVLVDWRIQLDDGEVLVGQRVAAGEENLLMKGWAKWPVHQRVPKWYMRAQINSEVRHGGQRAQQGRAFFGSGCVRCR